MRFFTVIALASALVAVAPLPWEASLQASAKAKAKAKVKANPHLRVETTAGSFTIELFAAQAPKTVSNFLGLSLGERSFVDHKTKAKTKRPFYDGLTFHRVAAGALIQGGCPIGNGRGGPGYVIPDEINAKALGLHSERVLDGDGSPSPRLQIQSEDDFYAKIVDPVLKAMGVTDEATFRAKKGAVDAKIRAMTLQEAYENLGYRYTTKHPTRPIVRGVLAMAGSGPNTAGTQFFVALSALPHLDGKHTPFGRVVAGMKVVDRLAALPVDKELRPRTTVRILSVRRARPPKTKRTR